MRRTARHGPPDQLAFDDDTLWAPAPAPAPAPAGAAASGSGVSDGGSTLECPDPPEQVARAGTEQVMNPVNPYGYRIRRMWTDRAPERVTGMADPEAFFAELGEQITIQVAELSRSLAGTAPPGEDYVQQAARLTAAQRQAEELVLADHLPAPDPLTLDPPTLDPPTLDPPIAPSPADHPVPQEVSVIDDVLTAIHHASRPDLIEPDSIEP